MASAGVERRTNPFDRRQELGDALEREVLAVHRDQHGVGGDERIERESPSDGGESTKITS